MLAQKCSMFVQLASIWYKKIQNDSLQNDMFTECQFLLGTKNVQHVCLADKKAHVSFCLTQKCISLSVWYNKSTCQILFGIWKVQQVSFCLEQEKCGILVTVWNKESRACYFLFGSRKVQHISSCLEQEKFGMKVSVWHKKVQHVSFYLVQGKYSMLVSVRYRRSTAYQFMFGVRNIYMLVSVWYK